MRQEAFSTYEAMNQGHYSLSEARREVAHFVNRCYTDTALARAMAMNPKGEMNPSSIHTCLIAVACGLPVYMGRQFSRSYNAEWAYFCLHGYGLRDRRSELQAILDAETDRRRNLVPSEYRGRAREFYEKWRAAFDRCPPYASSVVVRTSAADSRAAITYENIRLPASLLHPIK